MWNDLEWFLGAEGWPVVKRVSKVEKRPRTGPIIEPGLLPCRFPGKEKGKGAMDQLLRTRGHGFLFGGDCGFQLGDLTL